MTYEQYWYGDNFICKFYHEANRRRRDERNTELWLQGLYNYKALTVALYNSFKDKGKSPDKYFEEPIKIYPQNEKQKELEAKKERQKAVDFFEQMRLNYKKKNEQSKC